MAQPLNNKRGADFGRLPPIIPLIEANRMTALRPKSGHERMKLACQLRVITGLMHRNKKKDRQCGGLSELRLCVLIRLREQRRSFASVASLSFFAATPLRSLRKSILVNH
jgi:hypothetical protein